MGKLIFYILLLGFAPLRANAQTCMELFTPLKVPLLEKVAVKDIPTRLFSIHNQEIQNELAPNGVTTESISAITKLMYEKGGLDIPVSKSGFVAAANVGDHHGGYGNYVWHRDFARVYQGLAALPEVLEKIYQKNSNDPEILKAREQKKAAATAMVQLLGDPQWTAAALANIDNPAHHLDNSYGYKFVIWIRRLLYPFENNRQPSPEESELESYWGHKQNDALATFAESVLDAVENKDLSIDEFSEPAKQNLILLAAYFVRLEYWHMWDVGAWEEQLALRTSSIGLVANFLERFQKHFNNSDPNLLNAESEFFRHLKEKTLPTLLSSNREFTAQQIREALQTERLAHAVEQGKLLVQSRLVTPAATPNNEPNTRPVEAEVTDQNGTVTITRYEDMALLHMLWSKSQVLTVENELRLISDLKALEGDSGFGRYKEDWFLYGVAEAARNQDALDIKGRIGIPDGAGGFKIANDDEIRVIIENHKNQEYNKDLRNLVSFGGAGLEAQWTLGDAYLTQYFSDLYVSTLDSAHLAQAKYHYARLAGLISGRDDISSEGLALPAFRLPEAYIPIVAWRDGAWEMLYLTSPNSPLNWSTAEFILASQKMLKALAVSENSPR